MRQRERLQRSIAHPVHMLMMTATPIPRTLALVQYGSLVLSCINQMPPGRRPVDTRVVVDNDQGRQLVRPARLQGDRQARNTPVTAYPRYVRCAACTRPRARPPRCTKPFAKS